MSGHPSGAGSTRTLGGIRHRWDCAAGKWLTSATEVDLHGVLGKGGMRVAYKATEDGVPSVVKFSTIHKGKAQQKAACLRDSKAQSVSEYYAGLFNKTGVRDKVSFVQSYALELADGRWANIEPQLLGGYKKHNNNAGGVVTQDATAQAFSHFTYEASHHSLVVCDIQGVGGMYTDPQILSVPGAAGSEPFGDGDLGPEGIQAFLRTHRCNDLCRAAGLQENTQYRQGGGGSAAGMGMMGMPPGMGAGGMGDMRQLEGMMRQMMAAGGRGGGGGGGQRRQVQQVQQPRAADADGERDLQQALRQSKAEQERDERQNIQRALDASGREAAKRRGGGGGGRAGLPPATDGDEELARALAAEEWVRGD